MSTPSPHWITTAAKREHERRDQIHTFHDCARTFLISLNEAINKDLEVYSGEFPEDKAVSEIDLLRAEITVRNPQYNTSAVVAIDSEKQSIRCVYETREPHNDWEDPLAMASNEILWNGAGIKQRATDLTKKILRPVLFPAFPPGFEFELW